MKRSLRQVLDGKQCANPKCKDRVMVRGVDQEPYLKVEYRMPDELPDRLYYHVECAPLGSTRIPEELGL